MRTYEIMFIFDKDSEDESRDTILNTFKEGIKSQQSAEIIETDMWGLRPFAYEINKKTEGYYAVMEFSTSQSTSFDDLERDLRFSEDVVRYKILRLPDSESERRKKIRDEGGSIADTYFSNVPSSPAPSFPEEPSPDSQTSAEVPAEAPDANSTAAGSDDIEPAEPVQVEPVQVEPAEPVQAEPAEPAEPVQAEPVEPVAAEPDEGESADPQTTPAIT